MANILVNIEKGVEVAAKDVLKWLTGATAVVNVAPEAIAALGTLITAIEKPLEDIASATVNPLNVTLEAQTVTDLKAAWPALKTFLGTLGIKC